MTTPTNQYPAIHLAEQETLYTWQTIPDQLSRLTIYAKWQLTLKTDFLPALHAIAEQHGSHIMAIDLFIDTRMHVPTGGFYRILLHRFDRHSVTLELKSEPAPESH